MVALQDAMQCCKNMTASNVLDLAREVLSVAFRVKMSISSAGQDPSSRPACSRGPSAPAFLLLELIFCCCASGQVINWAYSV